MKRYLVLILLLASSPLRAATLSGIVRDTGGAALNGIPFRVMHISPTTGNLVTVAGSRSSTSALFDLQTIDLDPGEYWLRIDNVNPTTGLPTGYEGLYYHPDGNQPARDPATPILVGDTDLTGFEFTLRTAASISGQVTAPGVNDFSAVDFDVYDAVTGKLLPLITSTADSNGTYLVHGFPDGSYLVACDPPVSLGLYPVYQGNVFLKADATPLAVSGAGAVQDFALAPGFTVSGTVLDGAVGAADIDIDIFRVLAGNLVFIADVARSGTNPLGAYATGVLEPGDYLIRVDPSPDRLRVRGYYTTNAAPALTVEEGSAVSGTTTIRSGIDISLVPGGLIGGQLTAPGGRPAAAVDLDVFGPAGRRMGVNAVSDASGNYLLGALPAGMYIVRADPTASQFLARTYYPDAAHLDLALPVTVAASATTTAVNIQLSAAGALAGRITDRAGAPLGGIDLDMFDSITGLRVDADGHSNPDGGYLFGPVHPGAYIVRADPNPALPYLQTYYTNAVFLEDGVDVPVTAGTVTPAIDFSLERGGFIAGQLSAAGGGPAPAIDLDAFDALGRLTEVNAASDSNGIYRIGPLPEGFYTLRADPVATQYLARTYYSDTLVAALATDIAVTADATNSAIDIMLPAAGAVAGRVLARDGSPLFDIDIDVFYAATGARADADAQTLADGTYLIGPLPGGAYVVRADPGPGQPFLRTYYTDGVFFEDATSTTVTPSQTTANIDFSLDQGGFIAGHLAAAGGGPAVGVDLDVFNPAGQLMGLTTLSDIQGYYLLGPLPTGDYIVRADPEATQFLARTYYPSTLFAEAATLISVAAPATTSPIDLLLPPAGAIAGSIRDTQFAPVPGTDLDSFDATTGKRVDADGRSQADGTYLFGPVPVGTYFLRADPDASQFFVREYWQESRTQGTALPLTIAAGLTTPNIDFTLAAGAIISGHVRDLQGQPIAMVDIDVFPAGGGGPALEQTALSGTDGFYRVGPIPVGTWAVRANPSASQGYETRYFVSTGSITSSVPVPVLTNTPAGSIDFALGTNRPPQAAMTPFGGILPDGTLVLDAGASSDSNGDRVLFAWRQVGGPSATIRDPQAAATEITLPVGAPAGTVYSFEVTVRDFTTLTTLVLDIVDGPPRLTSVRPSAGQITLDWTLGSPAQPYTLQKSGTFISWTDVVTGTNVSHTLPEEDTSAAFRILAAPAP